MSRVNWTPLGTALRRGAHSSMSRPAFGFLLMVSGELGGERGDRRLAYWSGFAGHDSGEVAAQALVRALQRQRRAHRQGGKEAHAPIADVAEFHRCPVAS